MSEPDELLFADDKQTGESPTEPQQPWHILITDDDADVHATTLYALKNVRILGRPLTFLHAYSAVEALELLREHEVAVALLDVVMERDDAGLTLVKQIREELGLEEIRLILRTGQPGYAPETEAISNYDINDYKTKAELTRTKLYTTLTAAIRSYSQIRTINASRRGLALIVHGSAELNELQGLSEFAEGVITQIAALLQLPAEGVVCARAEHNPTHARQYRVVAAAGAYASVINCPLEELNDAEMRMALQHALEQRASIFTAKGVAIYFSGHNDDIAVYLPSPLQPDPFDERLLEVFASNIAVCLDNLSLFRKLEDQAYVDPLVALPNRTCFIEQIDQHTQHHRSGEHRIVLVDIDHFSELNDALGHTWGDQLLRELAGRMRTLLPDSVVIARVAADCFALFGEQVLLAIEPIRALFLQPFIIASNEQRISATFGAVDLEQVDGGGLDGLKSASIALNLAKQRARGSCGFYHRDMELEIQNRVQLLYNLRSSFEQERLFLHFQPQVRLSDGQPIGCEALIRWRTDEGTYIPPDLFIPLAERSGLIIPIGEWVLRTACLQAKALNRAGYKAFRMAVNVSMLQFRHEGFLDMLDRALAETEIDPRTLELEITESVAMLEADFIVDLLDAIHARGIQIALDDFGTGFSSLAYLQRLRIDRLKIDRAFVVQMQETERVKSIAAMVVDLGRSLGMSVIAEGVEQAGQADRLRDLGCDEAQGFFYARPMEGPALLEWLNAHNTGAR